MRNYSLEIGLAVPASDTPRRHLQRGFYIILHQCVVLQSSLLRSSQATRQRRTLAPSSHIPERRPMFRVGILQRHSATLIHFHVARPWAGRWAFTANERLHLTAYELLLLGLRKPITTICLPSFLSLRILLKPCSAYLQISRKREPSGGDSVWTLSPLVSSCRPIFE